VAVCKALNDPDLFLSRLFLSVFYYYLSYVFSYFIFYINFYLDSGRFLIELGLYKFLYDVIFFYILGKKLYFPAINKEVLLNPSCDLLPSL
jgi:hypothetical protein